MTLIELQHSIIIQSDVKADLGNRPLRPDPYGSLKTETAPSEHDAHREDVLMIGRIISFVFIPVFIWLLIGSYKEKEKDYEKSGKTDFLFSIFWLFAIAYATISLFLYAFFNASIVVNLKYW